MKAIISIFIFLLITITGSPAFGDGGNSRTSEGQDRIRIEYNRSNAPDSMVFVVLLEQIRNFEISNPGESISDWVFTQMNLTYSHEINGWIHTPNNNNPRHNRESMTELANLLLEVANRSYLNKKESERTAYCSSVKRTSMEETYAAFDLMELKELSDADEMFDYSLEHMSEQEAADMRAWIGRKKNGFRSIKLNYRVVWDGREDEMMSRLDKYCSETGGHS